MSQFNLSAWALRNKTVVLYAMVVLAIIGWFSYQRLGQSEDPPFTFKIMVVRTFWPGATAEEVGQQVSDRIEKKLMETGEYEFIRSYSRPGESLVQFVAKDTMHSRDIPALWYQVRKKVGDIRGSLPERRRRPLFQRRIRRHLRQHLCAHRRRLRLRDDEGLCRAHRARAASRSRRGQGRPARPAGRKDLDRAFEYQTGHPGHSVAGGAAGDRCAERGDADQLLRNRKRSRAVARERRLQDRRADQRTSRSAPAAAPSGSATWPRSSAVSPIRRRRACASWARTRSASPCR